jgi:conjugal transfer/type IV secretion protein DotA/TraY
MKMRNSRNSANINLTNLISTVPTTTTTAAKALKAFLLCAITLLTAFGTQLAWAIDVSGIQVGTLFTPINTDLSMTYIRNLFGDVGGLTGATKVTIFSQIFYIFNSGVLGILGVLLTYTMGRSIIEVAKTGQQQMNRFSYWAILRAVAGLALLMPSTGSGYSILHVFVMFTVVQSIGLADAIWTRAVNYVTSGGALYASAPTGTATTLGGGTQGAGEIDQGMIDFNPALNKKAGNRGDDAPAANILRSHLCMKGLYNALEAGRREMLQDVKTRLTDRVKYPDNSAARTFLSKMQSRLEVTLPSFTAGVPASAIASTAVGSIYFFPNNTSTVYLPNKNQYASFQDVEESKYALNLDGICGQYNTNRAPNAIADGGDTSGPNNYNQAILSGLQSMANLLGSPAQDAFSYTNLDQTTLKPTAQLSNDSAIMSLISAAASQQSATYDMRKLAGNGYVALSKGSVLNPKELTKDGWIGALYFHYRIAALQERFSGNLDSHYAPLVVVAPPYCAADAKGNVAPSTCTTRSIKSIISLYFVDPNRGIQRANDLDNRLAWTWCKNASSTSDTTNCAASDVVDLYSSARASAAQINQAAQKGINSGIAGLPTALQTFVYTAPNNGTLFSLGPTLGNGQYILLGPLSHMVGRVIQTWQDKLLKATDFPVNRLKSLGDKMITEVFDYWQGVFTTFGTILTAYQDATLSYTSGMLAISSVEAIQKSAPLIGDLAALGSTLVIKGMEASHAIADLVFKIQVEVPLLMTLPIVSLVTGLLVTNGIILAYYIPLLPFMLFLFGIISWLAFVAEAMIATPIVALGISYPEGHELLGRAETALMLLISVFVRPAAMLIGLIMGMVLSYVAFEVLNAGFATIIGDVFYLNNPSPSAPILGLSVEVFKHIILICFYVLVSIEIIKQCFNLINMLPDTLMRWIQGGVTGGVGGEATKGAEAIQQALTSLGEKVSGAYGQAAESGISKGFGEVRAAGKEAIAKGQSLGGVAGVPAQFVGKVGSAAVSTAIGMPAGGATQLGGSKDNK